MFPVDVEYLSIAQIADFWAAELVPADALLRQRRELNLRTLLIGAFWLGELVPKQPATRLRLLKSLHAIHREDIGFQIEGPYPRTNINDLAGTRITIPVPNNEPESWSADNCRPAFQTLAEKWMNLDGRADADPIIAYTEPTLAFRMTGYEIERCLVAWSRFHDWIRTRGFALPQFWAGPRLVANTEQKNGGRLKQIADVDSPARGPEPKRRRKVQAAILANIDAGRTSLQKLFQTKQTALSAEYGVSRETIKSALKAIAKLKNVDIGAISPPRRKLQQNTDKTPAKIK